MFVVLLFQRFFHHPDRYLWTLVHGDDYCTAGASQDLHWLQSELSKKYEIKTQRIGFGNDEKGVPKVQEGQMLNRVVRVSDKGWEYESD